MVIEDLGSTNGTYLNGEPLNGPQPAAPGRPHPHRRLRVHLRPDEPADRRARRAHRPGPRSAGATRTRSSSRRPSSRSPTAWAAPRPARSPRAPRSRPFQQGLPDDGSPPRRGWPRSPRAANERIHELSPLRPRPGRAWARRSPRRSSTATRSTIAHVGDSRALPPARRRALEPLTRDHSLVQALIDQGRSDRGGGGSRTRSARSSPARSAPSPASRSTRARVGGRDGRRVPALLRRADLDGRRGRRSSGSSPRAAACRGRRARSSTPPTPRAAGTTSPWSSSAWRRASRTPRARPRRSRSEAQPPFAESTQRHEVVTAAAAARAPARDPAPRPPAARRGRGAAPRRRSTAWRRVRRVGHRARRSSCPFLVGAWIATRAVYFVGTDARGLVTVFRGVPYDLPAGVHLYETLLRLRRARRRRCPPRAATTLLDHKLRSQSDASDLVEQLELGQVAPMSARNRELVALIPASLLVTARLRGDSHPEPQRQGRRQRGDLRRAR